MTKFIFEDELGKDWNIGKFVREEILTYSLENIIDDKRTGDEVETITAISATALEEALAKLGDQNYGDLCKLTLKHPLSRIKILDYWLDLNRGPYPASGDL
ncbi:MAG: hypothetical protein GWN61_16260, partial [candidate division Zixibacteria bacterium]|nr:hypothetical protein [candidate division KSB1 bacterium]NIV07680.1 hypothetical protein [candidate division Zixibacteria bacterium]NIS26085.1 hypothetical protein [candidate division KSB1 bacterium]NIT72884.1 hypothetical protein [candidate division KSB1 bacterium]NIU26727.1 hypothetical protein [candidate division KSB1 bacterium]